MAGSARGVASLCLALGAGSLLALGCSGKDSADVQSEAPITAQPATVPAPTTAAATAATGTTGGGAPSRPSAPGAPSSGCTKAQAGESLGLTVDVHGHSRTFDVAAPAQNDTEHGYPLVFVFHGGGGSADGARTTFHFADIAGDKAVFVYPQGTDGNWDLDSPTADNEDVAFFDAMLTTLSESHCIDRSRVFATGSSMGGYFTNQLACRRGDVLRGIAPHAGGGPFGGDDEYDDSGHLKCSGKAVAAMVFHGADDGEVAVGEGEQSVAYWRSESSCTDASTPIAPEPCVSYGGCKSPVVWCRIPGLGHDVWSEGPKATWDFFSRL
jgi:polyhydroxybutyrate depolymerase